MLSLLRTSISRLTCPLSSPPPSCLITSVRTSVWPKNYIDALPKKEEQEALDEEARKQLVFTPVKAAPNTWTSSVYFDRTVLRLENIILRKGNRRVARQIMDGTLAEIKRLQLEKWKAAKTEEEKNEIELDPVIVIKKGIENMKPVVMTKKIKRGGATYQVPHPVSKNESCFLAMKWLTDIIKDRPKPRLEKMHIVMARELVLALDHEGKTVKKKVEVHRLCEANKAYSHYRWG